MVFILRMDDGEDLLESIQKFVKEKCAESGMMLLLGAMKDGRTVAGPEKPVIPPVPHFETFTAPGRCSG
jgi:predicted DNA-binding protein with PD1-like motif